MNTDPPPLTVEHLIGAHWTLALSLAYGGTVASMQARVQRMADAAGLTVDQAAQVIATAYIESMKPRPLAPEVWTP